MQFGDLVNLVLGGVIGYVIALFQERRAELRRMGDRYIESAQANPERQADEFWRLGMLQKVGASQLSEAKLSRLCRRIANHGLQDPSHREISTVFEDHRRSLRGLLRWAAQEHFDLSNGDALMLRHLEEGGSMFSSSPEG
jgi:hypothetical protein